MSNCCMLVLKIASSLIDFEQKMTEDICRICLQKGSKNNFISLNFGQPSIKSKLSLIAPELNLEIISEPVVCGPCSATLENAYQFKIKCLRTEEKMWTHVHAIMTTKPINTPVKLLTLIPATELQTLHEEIMIEPTFTFYHNNEAAKTYQNLDQGKGHSINSLPPNHNLFVCTTCKQSFITKEELHSHIPTHLGIRPYMCTLCYKCFSLRSNLHIHMRTHTQDKPFTCELCPKCFTTKGNLITHIRVHTKEKPFLCSICDKTFTQKVQLNTHMLLHANDQIFACDICDKTFSSKSTLSIHKRIHDEVKPFTCDFCDKCFTTKGNLVIHTRTHTREKPYNCDKCDKSFIQRGQLQLHKKSHHEISGPCSNDGSNLSEGSGSVENPNNIMNSTIDNSILRANMGKGIVEYGNINSLLEVNVDS